MIKPANLIAKFRQALDEKWGYIYGKTHEMWSSTKQAEYRRVYESNPEKYKDRKLSAMNGGKWAGHWVTDCSGLFTWAFKQLGGEMYHGSNTMYRDWCTDKGYLNNGRRSDGKELKPGTAVFTGTAGAHGHVGLYAGDGIVIEAMGTENGVTTTRVNNKKWTFWGELKGVDYGASSPTGNQSTDNQGTEVNVKLTQARVTGGRLNMRMSPSTSATQICSIPDNSIVTVNSKTNDTWWSVTYKGKTGYVMTSFLTDVKEEDSTAANKATIVLDKDVALSLYDALKATLGK